MNKKDINRKLAQNGERKAAFSLLNKLMSEHPNNPSLWSLKGSLYARVKNYNEAIQSIDKAILLSPEQAIFYYHKGRYLFCSENIPDAIKKFNATLLKDQAGDITFTEEVYFHRAEAFIKLGKKKEALSDLSYVSDGYQTWTFKLRNKADLLNDCDKL